MKLKMEIREMLQQLKSAFLVQLKGALFDAVIKSIFRFATYQKVHFVVHLKNAFFGAIKKRIFNASKKCIICATQNCIFNGNWRDVATSLTVIANVVMSFLQLHHDADKTREEILSLISHHVTAVNYIYKDTKFDGRIEHRNIKFEVQRIKVKDAPMMFVNEIV